MAATLGVMDEGTQRGHVGQSERETALSDAGLVRLGFENERGDLLFIDFILFSILFDLLCKNYSAIKSTRLRDGSPNPAFFFFLFF